MSVWDLIQACKSGYQSIRYSTQTHSLKLCEINLEKGETVAFAQPKNVLHWSFECAEGSIPKTHPTLFHTIPIRICGYGGFL